jgi:phage shock protein C
MRPRPSFSAPVRHLLYRNPKTGMVFGVCAGLADYFGTDPVLVRVGMVIGLFFLFPPVVIAYLLAALIIPVRPPSPYRSPAEEAFWREAAARPAVTLDAVRQRFGDAERRLRALESHVASQEFVLSREIRDLDR